ncbi:MAG: hypothetical protein RLZZ352_2806 [Pseudomonadota bacterium]|jgi:hypothetical protein
MNFAVSTIKWGLALVAAWLLVACATGKTQASPPSWVLNPPSQSRTEYWGVGEGFDYETARRTALRSVASQLRVSISGSVENQTKTHNQLVDRAEQSRVAEVIQEIEFPKTSVEKSVKYNDNFFVLVKVDRQAFLKETQAKFDTLNRSVQNELSDLDRRSAIEQFRKLNAVVPNIDKAVALGQLLRIADPEFSVSGDLRRLETQRQYAANSASRVSFSIEHEPRDRDIANAVTTFFNSYGIRISPSERALVLRITTEVREDLLFGNKSHLLAVTFQLVDDKKQIIASKQYRQSGNSLETYSMARQDAVKKLANAMQAAGISVGLGL